MKAAWMFGLLVLAAAGFDEQAAAAGRVIPRPLEDHPGNVFLAGEEVTIHLPGDQDSWRLFDYDEQEIGPVRRHGESVSLGRLPVGFYRLKAAGQTNWVSCAVLARLKTATPLTSPVGLDVAMSWFYPREKMDAVSSLCALAGVNWVRDRLMWGELEGRRGEWSSPNRYDDAARIQSRFGLQVLQVNHLSPSWANPATKRFPLDLRDAYQFYREMARRWRGQVLAFEPWNEADIPDFGGHTGAEMAALQKASFLGLKAGAPDVIACLNVFALHNPRQLADLQENEAWDYFDTFNLHHYAPFDEYPKLYAEFRAVSAGRPLWVSECALPVRWTGDDKLKELSDADLHLQAERVAKTFACSLYEGAAQTFFFILPHFTEGPTQFGLLRPDLTPRPGYAALAAVGRFLAAAKPMGRVRSGPATARAFLFRAHPDGQGTNVLVAWATDGQTNLALPSNPSALFDLLGRPMAVQGARGSLALDTAPVFAILSDTCARELPVQPPPPAPPRPAGEPSPVVLQALMPESGTLLSQSAYRISSEKTASIPIFIYNFSDTPVSGRLQIVAPEGWKAADLSQVEIGPQSRIQRQLELDCRQGPPDYLSTVRVEGDFGRAGKPVLSLRLVPGRSLVR